MGGKTCCFGCTSVRTGTLIIAVLFILSCIYQLIKSSWDLVSLSRDPGALATTLSTDPAKQEEIAHTLRKWQSWLIVLAVAALLISLVQLALSGLLIHGVRTERPSRCWPWLKFNIGLYGLSVCGGVCLVLYMLICVSFTYAFVFFIAVAIGLGIQAYWILVVYECVLEMTVGEQGGKGTGAQSGQVHSIAVPEPVQFKHGSHMQV